MTYALSRLLAQKKKILFFIIWIPAAVFLFSYFRSNDAKTWVLSYAVSIHICYFKILLFFGFCGFSRTFSRNFQTTVPSKRNMFNST